MNKAKNQIINLDLSQIMEKQENFIQLIKSVNFFKDMNQQKIIKNKIQILELKNTKNF